MLIYSQKSITQPNDQLNTYLDTLGVWRDVNNLATNSLKGILVQVVLDTRVEIFSKAKLFYDWNIRTALLLLWFPCTWGCEYWCISECGWNILKRSVCQASLYCHSRNSGYCSRSTFELWNKESRLLNFLTSSSPVSPSSISSTSYSQNVTSWADKIA